MSKNVRKGVHIFKEANWTTQVRITLGRPSNIVEVDAIVTTVSRRPYLEFSFAFTLIIES
jgi:hypothetical protein